MNRVRREGWRGKQGLGHTGLCKSIEMFGLYLESQKETTEVFQAEDIAPHFQVSKLRLREGK